MSDKAAFIATHRFGLGPRPGEMAGVRQDPRGWLREQVGRQSLPDGIAVNLGTKAVIDITLNVSQEERQSEAGRALAKRHKALSAEEIDARLRHRMVTDAPFAERLVMFWANHFSLSAANNAGLLTTTMSMAFEREAIRPGIFGSFEELAFTALTHPAMVMYLDNERSIGPNSPMGSRRNGRINENLARETLELYIMGVDGGYTQPDVEQLALVLTGWSLRNRQTEGYRRQIKKRTGVDVQADRFGAAEFFGFMHEPGAKTVVGRTYEEAGPEEFRNVIRDLTRHPATARFLATKLARQFIADVPPASAIDRLAATFRETEGNLEAVSLMLIELDEAWQQPLSKAKTPNDYVLAASRALQAENAERFMPAAAMGSLGQPVLSAPDPQGWSDLEGDWVTPAMLMRRIEWTHAVIGRQFREIDPRRLLEAVIGDVASDNLKRAVRGAPSQSEGVALVLLSPEFQRR